VLLTAACDDTPGAEGTISPAADYEDRVLAVCKDTLVRTDCACFWDKARPAFTKANVNGILAALIERETYGNAITRVRLEKAAGAENASLLGRALFDCVKS
jgi:hypothetical protein